MRVAYLIMAHDRPDLVASLVGNIRAEWADIYLHVDKKSDITPFREALRGTGVRFIEERVRVNWMGHSMIRAELNLLRAASRTREYKYYKLLTGHCRPVKSREYLREFFENHHKNVVFLWPFEACASLKARFYYPIDLIPIENFLRRDRFRARPLRTLLRHPVQILFWGAFYLCVFRSSFLRRLLPARKPKWKVHMGETHWCLRHEFVMYLFSLLKEDPDMEKAFHWTHAADELFINTILVNSGHPYESKMWHANQPGDGSFYTRPYVLFGRKFTEESYRKFQQIRETRTHMRVAYLIMAHDRPDLVASLVRNIRAEWADIYLHVDKKSDIAPFQEALRGTGVRFIGERVRVNWMGYSVVRAELNLLRAASKVHEYKYYKLLSGYCQPIKSREYLREFFENHHKNVVWLWPFDSYATLKTSYYYPVDLIPIENFLRPDRFRARPLRYLLRHPVQMLFWGAFYLCVFRSSFLRRLLPRRKKPKLKMWLGEAWWCLRHDFVVYLFSFLKENPEVEKSFHWTHSPDELFINTILVNSGHSYERKLWHANTTSFIPSEANLLENEWLHTVRYTLFARKFDKESYEKFRQIAPSKVNPPR